MSLRVFGPVPSRRLGRSIGINNIPPEKICSYSCVYCQVGRSTKMSIDRSPFIDPAVLFSELKEKVDAVQARGEAIDYLTFVSDGEPTLDANLGKEIVMAKSLGLKVAVITNASLLWMEDVREDMFKADLVSVKVDAVDKRVWHRVNRPLRSLSLDQVLDGVTSFAKEYKGVLVSETMMIRGVNDSRESLAGVAEFLKTLPFSTNYISIPTRPPAESFVQQPDAESINEAYNIFQTSELHVELLIGYEGSTFSSATGNVQSDILSITSVHPMKKEAIENVLEKSGASWIVIEEMVSAGDLIQIEYQGETFFLRKVKRMK
jgi:wyosine [tRNA(Phe)-imidazoG37] synthetase (radical SAM superfamily)